MTRNRRTRTGLTTALCVLALAACGCVDYEERIEINPDGKTETLKMHLAVDERFVAIDWPKPTGAGIDSVFPVTLDELKKELNGDALELVDARANISSPMRHMYLVCKIKDLGKLSQTPAFAQRNLVLKAENENTWTLQQTLDVTGTSLLGTTAEQTAKMLANLEKTYGAENIRGILGQYNIKMSVTLPDGYTSESAGGKIHRDSTVIWQKSLTQLLYSREPWKMEARFVKTK